MSITKDDYPGVTEFGAVPQKVEDDTIVQIESEAANLRAIGTKNMFVSMGEHPTLGSVLILNLDDGTGGFVLADRVRFV
ncbi:hypothetical protein [Bradyrhizobium sp. CB1015]|uniref:hypothetical protein n=1 Tax=Bradyrhizobium sp. CB1015 TaxID=2976822 RepID=UPI0021A97CEF|nr:hypothetical protein [Bradyrhizobium sp. CB1015]UWU89770.1 hypothetical protein N2604_25145 [Bradyrhizobium sp. CB1015]